MKTIICAFAAVAISQTLGADTSNPVADFRVRAELPPPGKLLKWQSDINGDGKAEVFLSRKDDVDDAAANQISPGWDVYAARPNGGSYWPINGINQDDDSISLVALQVDLETCFVGNVSEVGQYALVTLQVSNPRAGDPIARIYAYTIEGDHLKRTKLAEYNPTQTNALFDKYLKDDKRTVITPVEVTQ